MTETVYLLRFYGYPISAPVIILSLEGSFSQYRSFGLTGYDDAGSFFIRSLHLDLPVRQLQIG